MHTANRASTEPFPTFSGFSYRPALPYQAGVSRRDPSPVLRAGGRYYVWYSRSTHDASGYWATIWYATSTDGLHWAEHGQALGRGPRGAFDEHAVFTPTVMVAEDCYWLYYTAVPEPFHNAGGGPAGTATRIGVASAAHPEGPWQRAGTDPILQPSATAAHFDSHRVDDSCLVRWGGEYRLVPLRGVSDRRPLSVHAAGWQRARPVRQHCREGDPWRPAGAGSQSHRRGPRQHRATPQVRRSLADRRHQLHLAGAQLNLAITKHKAAQYVGALERAFLLRQAFPAGANVLREPKVFMEPPYRLLYRSYEDCIGALREDFFALAMAQHGMPFRYAKSTRGAKTPDFLVTLDDRDHVIEVGGRGKGRSQFKGLTYDRKVILVHADDQRYTPGARVPLHCIGFA